MVTKKPKGLGRGLEALLGPKASDNFSESPSADNETALTSPGLPASLRLGDMVAGQYQPRTRMAEGPRSGPARPPPTAGAWGTGGRA